MEGDTYPAEGPTEGPVEGDTYPVEGQTHDTEMHDVEHIDEKGKRVMMGDNVGDESEVTYLTPSKVEHRDPPRKKMRAQRLMSPFVVTTETREQLKNTLPDPDMFDPIRPSPDEMVVKFSEYMAREEEEEEENHLDYGFIVLDRTFFHVLLKPESWLTDDVRITLITHCPCVYL